MAIDMSLRNQMPLLRDRFGQPCHLWMTQELDEKAFKMLRASVARRRDFDVTVVVRESRRRFAILGRHSHPPGFFAPAAAQVAPQSDFAAHMEAELKAETGLRFKLEKLVLHVTLDARYQDELIPWESFVFQATCDEPASVQAETRELFWVGLEQMASLAEKLVASEQSGLVYRGRLTNSLRWALEHELVVREATAKDHPLIEVTLRRAQLPAPEFLRTAWFVAEIEGFFAGNVGLKTHSDCMEMTGLAVDPIFRGRGVGNALVESLLGRVTLPEKRRRLSELLMQHLPDQLWLMTEVPGYFLPTGFTLAEPSEVPESLRERLNGMCAAMRLPKA
jgi:N-acetylglutamate synthase-like GNAT family acetyltransferase